MSHPPAFLAGATHSLNAYGQLFKLSETWRPHRSVAALYLWRISDIAKKIKNKKSLSK
jgi:3-methyladenine DNA glycosylase/8-oxoguanine DNA glycosylase